MPKHIRSSSLMLATLSLLAGTTLAEVTQNNERNLYFGETHMHTAYSLDAFIGGTRQTPSDAYRAAVGNSSSSSVIDTKRRGIVSSPPSRSKANAATSLA